MSGIFMYAILTSKVSTDQVLRSAAVAPRAGAWIETVNRIQVSDPRFRRAPRGRVD